MTFTVVSSPRLGRLVRVDSDNSTEDVSVFMQHLVSPDICPCSWAGLGISAGRTPRLSSSCEAKQTCPFAQAVTHSRCAGFKTGRFVVSAG